MSLYRCFKLFIDSSSDYVPVRFFFIVLLWSVNVCDHSNNRNGNFESISLLQTLLWFFIPLLRIFHIHFEMFIEISFFVQISPSSSQNYKNYNWTVLVIFFSIALSLINSNIQYLILDDVNYMLLVKKSRPGWWEHWIHTTVLNFSLLCYVILYHNFISF